MQNSFGDKKKFRTLSLTKGKVNVNTRFYIGDQLVSTTCCDEHVGLNLAGSTVLISSLRSWLASLNALPRMSMAAKRSTTKALADTGLADLPRLIFVTWLTIWACKVMAFTVLVWSFCAQTSLLLTPLLSTPPNLAVKLWGGEHVTVTRPFNLVHLGLHSWLRHRLLQ